MAGALAQSQGFSHLVTCTGCSVTCLGKWAKHQSGPVSWTRLFKRHVFAPGERRNKRSLQIFSEGRADGLTRLSWNLQDPKLVRYILRTYASRCAGHSCCSGVQMLQSLDSVWVLTIVFISHKWLQSLNVGAVPCSKLKPLSSLATKTVVIKKRGTGSSTCCLG
jgi:hypothetical protein